jgi:hypothetical protein
MKILQVPSMPVILAGANNHGHVVICVSFFYTGSWFRDLFCSTLIEIDLKDSKA